MNKNIIKNSKDKRILEFLDTLDIVTEDLIESNEKLDNLLFLNKDILPDQVINTIENLNNQLLNIYNNMHFVINRSIIDFDLKRT